jgi:hypothetical protein
MTNGDSRRRSRTSTRTRVGLVLVLGALTIGTVACSKGSGSSSTSTTTPVATTASTTAASTTTTQPATPVTPIKIATPTDGTSPNGSGCSPSGTTLPDGTWFGYLTSVDAAAQTFGLDLACFWVGPAANAKAAELGKETPVPNDYIITNVSPTIFTVPAWPNVQVVRLEQIGEFGFTGGLAPATTGLVGATPILTTPANPIVWVQMVGGKALVIQAQFTP